MAPNFLVSQFTTLPKPTKSFAGQTIIVTGSNTGLGLEAARHFVNLNAARVILAVRSLSKGEAAKANIEESSGRKDVVEVWHLDMSNYQNIQEFAKKCESLDRLDVVCENAGIATDQYKEAEGTEMTVAVNVIGTFLLALNLLPILRKSGEKTGVVPRLVITSSEVHRWAKFAERHEDSIFEALSKNNKTYMSDRYNTSKLLEVFTVRALARDMTNGPHAKQPVILNNVNPGLCHSELVREASGLKAMFFYILKLILARTTEVGARTIVTAAIMGDESHGQYTSTCAVEEPSELVTSAEGAKTQERIWTELKAILEKVQPGVTKNI